MNILYELWKLFLQFSFFSLHFAKRGFTRIFFGKVYTYTFEKIRAKTAAYHVNFQFQMRDMEKSLSGCAASTLSFHDSTLTSKLIKSVKTYILTHHEIHFE